MLTRPFATAWNDISSGISRYELWLALAQDDLRQRYRRTAFGLAWLTLSYFVFIAVKILIFGAINPQPMAWFAAYVAVGFLVWQLLNSFVVDGCDTFINSETWIKGVRLPYSTYLFESVARNVIVFLYSAVVALAILLITGHLPGPAALTSLAAIPLIIFNGFCLQMILAVVCLRFRDVSQIIQTAMRVMFFLTPLVWTPDQVGQISALLVWNPFNYLIDIVRVPLVDGGVPVLSWAVSLGITGVLAVTAIAVFARFRKSIPFWF